MHVLIRHCVAELAALVKGDYLRPTLYCHQCDLIRKAFLFSFLRHFMRLCVNIFFIKLQGRSCVIVLVYKTRVNSIWFCNTEVALLGGLYCNQRCNLWWAWATSTFRSIGIIYSALPYTPVKIRGTGWLVSLPNKV